ncbi:hypothetical protein A2154_01230 [Candidatus Gottesmanbacteria bacterium RBG_16_43_7]|uniref:tRNA/rRNA methyltransferase SpoU type domain-containing protein n=1 Tax=Candidatus Gottesmanbacteria bacterium RBG_16_43_7 TaxID=1798373 RepID=A0A1F5Z8E8_9BACT|nr:MAG: hypothetical protein A2154_01230 [Candidatus Gottesmanbacteria bacterium RBG_16_43_7]
MKLNAKQLRTTAVDPVVKNKLKKHDIYLICDNVLDTYNVGSIFRLADAVAVSKVFLCGQTLTPPNSRIKKASINTWEWVDWEYYETAREAISKCKIQYEKCKIIAVEQDKRSVSFYSQKLDLPLAIVVGNETYGVSEEVRNMADMIVELPVWGINKSLNVMVSLGIVLYEVLHQITENQNLMIET